MNYTNKFSGQIANSLLMSIDKKNKWDSGYAPEAIIKWFEGLGIKSVSLLRFMQWDWPQKSWDIGGIEFFSSKEIYEDDERDMFNQWTLLYVGRACDGDSVWLDYSSEEAPLYFLPLGRIYGAKEDNIDPRTIGSLLAPSLDVFLYRVREGLYIPNDFYTAKAFNEVVQKHNNYYRS